MSRVVFAVLAGEESSVKLDLLCMLRVDHGRRDGTRWQHAGSPLTRSIPSTTSLVHLSTLYLEANLFARR
jgi:hypothetical protein